MTTALIDADIIAHRVAASSDYELNEDCGDAVRRTLRMVREWTRMAGADSIICCLSAPRCFRYDLWPDYKANRHGRERPTFLEECRQAIRDTFTVADHHGCLEADDVIGILMTDGSVEDPIAVSIDKDLKQIHGWHYNPDKELRFPVTSMEAYRHWLMQWVCGDPTDGFPGIPGVGPKRAKVLLDAEDPMRAIILRYMEAGLSHEYMTQMARVSKVLTARDWDVDNKRPYLCNLRSYESVSPTAIPSEAPCVSSSESASSG